MSSFQQLEMRDIRKSFPGIVANDGISLSIKAGEILGLLGENGAGKSTLMNILFGLVPQDSGDILLNDRVVSFRSPQDALAAEIGMVHQHFMLIPNHTVAQNLALAIPGIPWNNPEGEVRTRLQQCAERYGLHVDPEAFIWQLSAGEQQRVEIIKALLSGCRLLVLDEPTSVLTPPETAQLLEVLRTFSTDGGAVIFITHKLEEVLSVAHRLTVLRRGRLAGTLPAAGTSRAELARLMIGRELSFSRQARPVQVSQCPVLQVSGLSVQDDRGRTAVQELSFVVHEGEILGVAGVAGNGQRELIDALTGLRSASAGAAVFRDRDLSRLDARSIADSGVAHIPEDRLRHGVAGNLSLQENAVLKSFHRAPFSRLGFLSPSAAAGEAQRIIHEYEVAVPSLTSGTASAAAAAPPATANLDASTKNLSGGNLQKFIVGRELAGTPPLVVASHPTYGVDVGAAETIHRQLLRCRDAGSAVLLVSEDLSELFRLSDRVAVMYEGRFAGILDPDRTSLEEIGLLMTGSTPRRESSE